MPVYNAERYVGEAVRSILEQTFADFDFVIIDDGSTDRSTEILEQFASDPRIRLIRRPNTGYLRALNEGLALCQGEFIARMDADDVSLPDRLRRQIAFLDEHPECLMVGCALLRIDDDGDVLCEERLPEDHAEIEARLLEGRGAIGHPAALIRRQALVELGGYREPFYGAEDHDLWLRLAERGRLANLPEAGIDRMRAWTRSALDAGQYRTGRKHALAIWRQRPWQIDSWILLARALFGRWARPLRHMYRRVMGR